MPHPLRALSLGVCLISACGGPSTQVAAREDAGTDAFVRPLPGLEEVRTQWIEKTCEQRAACESLDPTSAIERFGGNVNECRRRERAYKGVLDRYLDEGTVRFDAEAGRACLDSFEDLCRGNLQSECDLAFVGTVPLDGACRENIECASGLCATGDAACGTCAPTASEGEACSAALVCARGTTCTGGFCRRLGSVLTIREVGKDERCGRTDGALAVCGPALRCDTTSQRCRTRRPVGETCEEDRDGCARGALCERVGEVSQCVAIAWAEGEGADCGLVGDRYVACSSDNRMYCDYDGHCQRLAGDGSPGSECNDDDDCRSQRCENLGGGVDRCVSGQSPVGAPCQSSRECASGHCDGRAEGGPRCAAGSRCR